MHKILATRSLNLGQPEKKILVYFRSNEADTSFMFESHCKSIILSGISVGTKNNYKRLNYVSSHKILQSSTQISEANYKFYLYTGSNP